MKVAEINEDSKIIFPSSTSLKQFIKNDHFKPSSWNSDYVKFEEIQNSRDYIFNSLPIVMNADPNKKRVDG